VQTITHIVGECGMEAFHAEFEKMFNTLMQVHDNERRRMKRCQKLNDDIAGNVGRVTTVLKMTEEEEMNNLRMKTVNRCCN